MNRRHAVCESVSQAAGEVLAVPVELFHEMIRHAREESPLEACGYLAGGEGTVARLFRMKNADASRTHFSFVPEEQFAVMKKARAEGLALIGVYHSHPMGPAYPSEEDIRMAYDPGLAHIIVSLLPSGRP